MIGRIVVGGVAGLDIYVSYWNWYGFPTNYTAAVMLDQVIGFTLAGIVLGAIIKPAAGVAASPSETIIA